ncbi:hypothetical protein ACIBEJ_32730 [Nonomuraea sp. NPDC050790]|uniref:hypothetical protein n=1 Tax=Nonomuraea sp. NPDC050790 TaxID=3364371 RepID=UPI00379BBF52
MLLFEPRRAIRMPLPNGAQQEMQLEHIIQAGFQQWRAMLGMEALADWSVRQTHRGV